MTTASDELVQLISKGLSHKAISQFDKHSDEQSLQRVSEEVIEACSQFSKIVKTDVPELRRPWFAELHDKIISPLFVSLFLHGLVFFTDDNGASLTCYRQNPHPRNLIALSSGSLDPTEEDQVPLSPDSTEVKDAKWQFISGLTLIDDDANLLVADYKLGKIRILCDVNKILQNPKRALMISNLNLVGLLESFHPFSVRLIVTRKDGILVCDPLNKCVHLLRVSDNRDSLTSLHVIRCGNSLAFPMDCLCFGDNALIVTEGRNNIDDTAGIRFLILDHAEERIEFNFMLPSENSSPFGLCELGDKTVCSDLGSPYLYELNVDTRDVSVIAWKLDNDGTDDGPVETATFSSPSGLASRGEVLCISEHPLNQ